MFIRGENPIRSSLRNGENHLPYRADIDGLRAIAILPVVLFHAGVPGLGGGFVGVDVFFVISGYLMCSLITGEMALGKFSLAGFYQRRIRRIFPALFAMMLTCAVVAWFAFMPQELLYFARSMTAASLFASNIQFAKEAGYFDIGAQMKPLLHTWSLAVEEQFYIGFPLLMILLQRLLPRQIMPVMLVALAASFAASIGVLNQNPTAGFYLSQYRVWELLIGVILGLGAIPELRSETGRQVLAAIGLVLIGIAVFVFTEKTAFRDLPHCCPVSARPASSMRALATASSADFWRYGRWFSWG
ncbi:acyltransferase (plasmid) [Sinorhizobium sp. B11]